MDDSNPAVAWRQIVPVFLIGFAILMGFAMVYISAVSRRNALARSRAGRTEETFAEYLGRYGFDESIARSTYRYLREKQRVSFPIEPMDDLDRDLGLDGEDVKTTLRDLLDETGREYLPGLLDSPLVHGGGPGAVHPGVSAAAVRSRACRRLDRL